MKIRSTMFIAFFMACTVSGVYSQENLRSQQSPQERIYGGDMMTQNERLRYMNQMENAKSEQEREQIRNQHRLEMDARIRERNQLRDGAGRGSGGGRGR